MYHFHNITLRPKNKQEWFNLWLILVLIIIIIYFFIIIIDRPMDTTDFMQYMHPISSDTMNQSLSSQSLSSQSLSSQSLSSQSILNSDIMNSYNQLSSEKLLNIPQQYIPNITDYTEDELW